MEGQAISPQMEQVFRVRIGMEPAVVALPGSTGGPVA